MTRKEKLESQVKLTTTDLMTNEELASYEGQEKDENGRMNYTELLNNLNLSGGKPGKKVDLE